MNSKLKAVIFLLAVAIVAVVACVITNHCLREKRSGWNAHSLIHDQLDLTPEQIRIIEESEVRFANTKRILIERIQAANKELADALVSERKQSPRVADAISKIHQSQAELQQATIDHVFEMGAALRPDQYDKLLSLTAAALSDSSH